MTSTMTTVPACDSPSERIEELGLISGRLYSLARAVAQICHEGIKPGERSRFEPNSCDATNLAEIMMDLAEKQGELLDIPGGWEQRFKEVER